MTNPMKVPPEAWERIEREITSDSSPVGIDAKKTHIIILHTLERMEKRLKRMEDQLAAMQST